MSSPPFIHPPLCSALSVIKPPDCVRCLLLWRQPNQGPWLRTQMIRWWSVRLGSSFLCPQPDIHSPGSSRRELGSGAVSEGIGCMSAHTLVVTRPCSQEDASFSHRFHPVLICPFSSQTICEPRPWWTIFCELPCGCGFISEAALT